MPCPPTHAKVLEHTLFGLTYRRITGLAGSGLAAQGFFFSLRPGVDLGACGIAAVPLSGLSAAVAFGVLERQLPEVWLWHGLAYRRRSRYSVRRARRSDEPQAVLTADPVAARPGPAPVELPLERVALDLHQLAGRCRSGFAQLSAGDGSSTRCSDQVLRQIQPRGIQGGTQPDSALW